jgi:hypothetical protein
MKHFENENVIDLKVLSITASNEEKKSQIDMHCSGSFKSWPFINIKDREKITLISLWLSIVYLMK